MNIIQKAFLSFTEATQINESLFLQKSGSIGLLQQVKLDVFSKAFQDKKELQCIFLLKIYTEQLLEIVILVLLEPLNSLLLSHCWQDEYQAPEYVGYLTRFFFPFLKWPKITIGLDKLHALKHIMRTRYRSIQSAISDMM